MAMEISLYDGTKNILEQSTKYPYHICEKGHLVLENGENGYNQVMNTLIQTNAYHMFDTNYGREEKDEKGKSYKAYSLEELQQVKQNVEQALQKLQETTPYYVKTIPHTGQSIKKEDALRFFNEAQKEEDPQSYFHKRYIEQQTFLPFPLPVKTIMVGTTDANKPAFHVIYEWEELPKYIEITEIILEFVECALSCENPRIYWKM